MTTPRLMDGNLVVANEGQRIDIPDGCILENSESAATIMSHY